MKESLNIFFSYGHDENSFIVEKIKSVLTDNNHRHNVWIDKEQIHHTNDWRQKIVNGINSSDEVVAFLSSYGLNKRETSKSGKLVDGVCRDELSIAVSIEGKTIITVLLESEEKIEIPTTISGIQWLDMSDWREKYAIDGETNGPVFTAYFNDKMAQILEAIETPEIFIAEGEIKALKNSLMIPSARNSMYFYLLKKNMIGRLWLSEIFNRFVSGEFENRFLLISGGPGFGKSHFIVHAIHYRPEVIAGYFFDYKKQTKNSIKDFIRDIAFQIASRIPMYRENLIKRLTDDGFYMPNSGDEKQSVRNEHFREFINENTPAFLLSYFISDLLANSIDGNIGNRIIVIDGVDEASLNNKNPLIDFLCDKNINSLPKWCKFVITSRNEEELNQYYNILDIKRINLNCKESEYDVREYLHYRLDKFIDEGKISAQIIDIINQRCEQSFVFAEKLCDAYETDPSILENPDSIPKNIAGLYTLYFDRLYESEDFSYVKNVLEIITACGGRINQSILKSIMNWDDGMLNSFVFRMKSFIVRAEEQDGKTLAFYHKTVSEWLSDPESSGKYSVSTENGEKIISEYCKNIIALFTSQNTSVGFRGEKLPVPYVVIKFAYINTVKFGSSINRKNMLLNLPFLYVLQRQSYISSDFALSYNIAKEIDNSYELMLPKQKKEYLLFYLSSKSAIGEIKIAKDNIPSALTVFYDIERKYGNELKSKFVDLYCTLEFNISYCIRRTDIHEAEIRLGALLSFIESTDYGNREIDIATANYFMSVILYDKAGKFFSEGKYEKSKEACLESIECGEKAINLSDMWFEDSKSLKLQCYNQMGSCYWRLAEIYKKSRSDKDKVSDCYKKQLEFKEKSLSYRLESFGIFNRFTANAYDYMARAILDLNRWQERELPPSCMEYVEMALKINSYVFGEKSGLYARSLQTKIFILEYEKRYDEALPIAEKQYEIYSSLSNTFDSDIQRAAELLTRIKNAVSHNE